MNIYFVEQNTEEWMLLRCGKLTASDAQAIASKGKGLETLCQKKVAEILAGQEPSYQNADTERGHELEEMARVGYELATGNTVKEAGFFEMDDMVGASPDGLVGDDGLIEIKCKIGYLFVKEKMTDEIDTEHAWQMTMQMLVTGRQWVDYVVFNPNFPSNLIIKRFVRDEDKIKQVQEGLDAGKEMIKNMLDQMNK